MTLTGIGRALGVFRFVVRVALRWLDRIREESGSTDVGLT